LAFDELAGSMNGLYAARRIRSVGLLCAAGAAMLTAGCANMRTVNPLEAGGVNPDSTVSAEVVAATRAPGPYPRFSQIPPPSTDVRSVPDWRAAVVSEWGRKRQTEREAAAIPFTLANTEAWAERTRAKIPASERSQPAPSVAEQTEAYAAGQRARATPPPPPQ
jgi:hypothetical protein